MRPAASSRLASFVGPQSSVVIDVERSANEVVRARVDEKAAEKEVAVFCFEQQPYGCAEVWLTTFEIDKVQTPLRNVSQKHQNGMLEILQ